MKPAVWVAIVCLVVGICIGYAVWGASSRQVEDEMAGVKARLAEAQQASVREGQMATKIQEIEAQVKQATESLKTETDAREKLEKVAAKLTKKK